MPGSENIFLAAKIHRYVNQMLKLDCDRSWTFINISFINQFPVQPIQLIATDPLGESVVNTVYDSTYAFVVVKLF